MDAVPSPMPHLASDVGVKSIAVLAIELLRVVMGWLLGAHIVNGAAGQAGRGSQG